MGNKSNRDIDEIMDKYQPRKRKRKKWLGKLIFITVLVLVLAAGGLYLGGRSMYLQFIQRITQTNSQKNDGSTNSATDKNNSKDKGGVISAEKAEKIGRANAEKLLGIDLTDATGNIKYIDVANNESFYEMNFHKDEMSIGVRVRNYDEMILMLSRTQPRERNSAVGMDKAQQTAQSFMDQINQKNRTELKLHDKVKQKNDEGEVVAYEFRFEADGGKEREKDCTLVRVDAHDGYVEYYKQVIF